MGRRIVATVLWFLTGWYATAIVAVFVGFNLAIAPFVGAAVGAFVAMDPLGLFWPRVARTGSTTQHEATLATDRA